MNLTQLRYFQHLAKRQHLLKTAEELHVSPSTLSASLKALEDELDAPLFDRVGRRLRLNQQGEALLPHVDAVFASIESGRRAVERSLDRGRNELAFSFRYTAFYHELVPLVLAQHPGLSIRHYDLDADDQGALIWERDLDLMISAKDFSADPKLAYRTISTDRFCLAVGPHHWLAARTECSLLELKDETFLNRPKDNYYQACVDALLEEASFRPKATMEAGYMLRPALLRAQECVAITTMGSLTTSLFAGLHKVRIRELQDRTYELRAYWRKDRPRHPASETLIRTAISLAPMPPAGPGAGTAPPAETPTTENR